MSNDINMYEAFVDLISNGEVVDVTSFLLFAINAEEANIIANTIAETEIKDFGDYYVWEITEDDVLTNN